MLLLPFRGVFGEDFIAFLLAEALGETFIEFLGEFFTTTELFTFLLSYSSRLSFVAFMTAVRSVYLLAGSLFFDFTFLAITKDLKLRQGASRPSTPGRVRSYFSFNLLKGGNYLIFRPFFI